MDSAAQSKRPLSRFFYRIFRGLLLGFTLIWAGLSINAWKYFSEAGVHGAYLSARYAINVLDLPEPSEPADLQGRVALTRQELISLIEFGALRTQHQTRRELRSLWTFVAPNMLVIGSTLSIQSIESQHPYLIAGNSLCILYPEGFATICFKFYRDREGAIFRYFPGIQGVPLAWIPVTIKRETNNDA